LALRQFGRFGNQVTQLFHAVSVAHYLGASTLYVVDADPFGLKADRYIDRLRFVPDRWQSNHEVVLEGSFYYRSDLGDMVSTDVDERLGLVRAFLDPLFAATLDEVRPSDDTTVHVHFRSGDVFRAAWIHPGYPQPPLSYYQASIERAMAESEVRSVVVVCEDDANPCVAALADWLDGKHIARRMQSASLAEDLAELLSARRLVSSYGSFCDAIALLSRSLQHYTVFRSTRWHPELHAKGVSVTQVMDDGLEPYIRVGAWRASPEQLQTMLTYPHGSLILPPPT
jgi:hypothetical protein